MLILQKYWLYIDNISNKHQYCAEMLIRNIYNVMLILQKYWLYIGNISNKHQYCTHIGFILEKLSMKRQYCTNIGFT